MPQYQFIVLIIFYVEGCQILLLSTSAKICSVLPDSIRVSRQTHFMQPGGRYATFCANFVAELNSRRPANIASVGAHHSSYTRRIPSAAIASRTVFAFSRISNAFKFPREAA